MDCCLLLLDKRWFGCRWWCVIFWKLYRNLARFMCGISRMGKTWLELLSSTLNCTSTRLYLSRTSFWSVTSKRVCHYSDTKRRTNQFLLSAGCCSCWPLRRFYVRESVFNSQDVYPLEVFTAEYVVDNKQLGFLVTDSDRNLILYHYQPEGESRVLHGAGLCICCLFCYSSWELWRSTTPEESGH